MGSTTKSAVSLSSFFFGCPLACSQGSPEPVSEHQDVDRESSKKTSHSGSKSSRENSYSQNGGNHYFSFFPTLFLHSCSQVMWYGSSRSSGNGSWRRLKEVGDPSLAGGSEVPRECGKALLLSLFVFYWLAPDKDTVTGTAKLGN